MAEAAATKPLTGHEPLKEALMVAGTKVMAGREDRSGAACARPRSGRSTLNTAQGNG